MAETQIEQLERILSEILDNDAEIRDGAEAARLDLDTLRRVVLRQQDDVWKECLAEQNEVEKLKKERSSLSEIYGSRGTITARRRFYNVIAFGVVVCVIYAIVALIIGGPQSIILPSLIIIVLVVLALLSMVSVRLRLARIGREWGFRLEEIQPRLNAAEQALEQALREKGIRGMLRETINVRAPSYSQILQVRQAAGLAELRDPLYEIRTEAKKRIQDLLTTMPGGSIGVSGPRGVGKTTLLRDFCSPRFAKQPDNGRPDLRVLISAPVQYDARDFVIYLFSAVCQAALGPEKAAEAIRRGWQSRPERHESALLSFARPLAVAFGVLLPLYGILLLLSVIFNWKLNPNLAPGILLVVIGLTILYAVVRMSLARRDVSIKWSGFQISIGIRPRGQSRMRYSPLQEAASDLLLGLTYQQTFARGWSGTVKLPVGLEGGLTSTTTMMDRPMSYPEVVARLSDFLKLASATHRILIGIDEMDKIESSELASQFLNDLKAVFGLENCFWLVSVSQNAMSAFERRGLPLRDAFDSSFDVIVEVDYMDLGASKQLLQRRAIGMSAPFLCLCHCLSGGLPRDLIRVARELLEHSRAPQASQKLADLTHALIASDMDRKLRAIAVTAAEVALEPQAGDFLDSIQTIRVATTSEKLLAACRTLNAEADDDSPNENGATEAQLKLIRLRRELATYYYYCATLTQFFNSDLTEKRLKAAEEASNDASIDQLAQARQAFAVSPQVTWSMTSAFRRVYSMNPELSFNSKPEKIAARAEAPGARQEPAASVLPVVPD